MTGLRPAPGAPRVARPAALARIRAMPRPELLVLLVLAGVLYLWALGRNGWANEYYSAAVRSMSTSWHAFLYGSFDSSGVMTVDKPPLALWVQALSVRAFGFHPLAMLVPQALMGMASVGLLYDLVRRRFGRLGGFAGGLVLALTPMTVAISRHNNPDALLVLCSVAAVWCVVRAFDDGRTRWIVLAGLCVGLGFEAKMAVALMVVPGIALAWLWVAPRGRVAALRQLSLGGVAMTVVGLAWPLMVALTPASDQPWVSGTGDNSVWSLILGYNGLGRLDGQAGGPRAPGGGPGWPGGGPGGGRPFGRSGWARRRAGGRRAVRRVGRAAAAAQPEPGRSGGLAARLRCRRAGRARRRDPAAAGRRAHRLADRRGRVVRRHGRRVQLREGHLPSLLRVAAGAVPRGAGGRRGGAARRRRPRVPRARTGRGRGRARDRAGRAERQPG